MNKSFSMTNFILILMSCSVNLLSNYIIFSFIFLSLLMIALNRHNMLILFFSIELALFGCITIFILFSLYTNSYISYSFELLLLVMHASEEVCMGLVILIISLTKSLEEGLKMVMI